MELLKEYNKNLIFVSILWVSGLIFSVVFLNALVGKYRNHSNIKAFLDNIEKYKLPDDLKDKK